MMVKPEVAGQCGCGRSPTGKCIGWHALSESEFKSKLSEFVSEEFRKEQIQKIRNLGKPTNF